MNSTQRFRRGILVLGLAAALGLARADLRLVTSLDTLADGAFDTCRISAVRFQVTGTFFTPVIKDSTADRIAYLWTLFTDTSFADTLWDSLGPHQMTIFPLEDTTYILRVQVGIYGLDTMTIAPDSVGFTIMTKSHPVAGQTWQMVSLPRHVRDYSAGAVLGNFDFHLFHWHEGVGRITGNYINYLNRGFAQGYSYWLKTDSTGWLFLPGSWYDTTRAFSLLLEEGWNQIANPFGYDILWDDVYFKIEGQTPVTVKESRRHSKPRGIWEWDLDTNNYVWHDPAREPAVMRPWRGYWVLAPEQTRIFFKPVPYFTLEADTGAGSPKAAPLPGSPWAIQLTAAQNGAKDPSNYCGLAPEASDGVGSEDCLKPPALFPWLSLAFAGNLCQDIRRADGEATWTLRVASPSPLPVTLAWYGVDQTASSYQLWLQDPEAGVWTNLRQAPGYRYTAPAGERRFTLVATEDPAFGPEQVACQLVLLAATPNPFTAGTRISFYLPAGGLELTPVLKVFDTRGEQTAVVRGRACQPYIIWDGTGAASGPGIYFFEIKAGDFRAAGKVVKAGSH